MADSLENPVSQVEEILERSQIGRFHVVLLTMCGLSFMMDALEISLLPFLINCVGVEWGLQNAQKATIASVVFFGILIGCFFWGLVGDRWGRRYTYLAASFIITVAGFMTSFASSYPMLLFLRGIVGFGIGGSSVPFDLLAEFLPHREHGRFLVCIEYFFTLGSVIVVGLAWMVLSPFGWETLTAVTAIPIAIGTIVSCAYLPESPRWLMTQGRGEEAMAVLDAFLPGTHLHQIVTSPMVQENEDDNDDGDDGDGNEVEEITSPIVLRSENEPRQQSIHRTSHRIKAVTQEPRPTILHEYQSCEDGPPTNNKFGCARAICRDRSQFLKTILPLWTVWLAFGMTYNGTVLYISQMYSTLKGDQDAGEDTMSCRFDYPSLMFSAASESVGTTVAIFALFAKFSHMRAQLYFYLSAAVTMIILGVLRLYPQQSSMIAVVSFTARVSVMAASTLTWVMTPALLPTQNRSFGHALCVAWSKIGAILAPYLVYGVGMTDENNETRQIDNHWQETFVAVVLAVVNLSAALALWQLFSRPSVSGESHHGVRLQRSLELQRQWSHVTTPRESVHEDRDYFTDDTTSTDDDIVSDG